MTNDEFSFYYDLYYVKLLVVQRIARKLATDDEELYQDLVQVGLIRLSKLVPSKATTNTDAWIRQSMKYAMVDYLRKNQPKHYESLDSRLAAGDQIEEDEATGTLRLVSMKKGQLLESHHDDGRSSSEIECEDDLYD